eukprot:gnl/TRDRNA2_/TRDRNA2_168363_c1_seq2.p1 gnl/TRDRNA2_/TRDRNA2_168363_c1~~gnl/TRDRNA2_/TRDRNA2_168363_c1_seq2.p1  ORF type:complete len:571 (+),score=55.70 gnl/TRDRNA2_/TRDRNA2_168363_c1_seq2:38-1714(+)
MLDDQVPIASGNRPDVAKRLIDGVTATAWAASCEGPGLGKCAAGQSWVGIDLFSAHDVQCVRVLMDYKPYEDDLSGAGLVPFALETWDGKNWTATQSFSVREIEKPKNAKEERVPPWLYLPQPVNVTESAWRLLMTSKLLANWVVHELKFYRSANCENPIRAGSLISSDEPRWRDQEAPKAFDDDPETAWVSQCGPCKPGGAFLGQSWDVPVRVRCILLNQASDFRYKAASVQLQKWEERTVGGASSIVWSNEQEFFGLVAGGQMLSQSWRKAATRFAIANAARTTGGWRVAELELFQDEECTEKVTGLTYSFDDDPPDAERAGDGNIESFWHADCCASKSNTLVECDGCDIDEAWLGFMFLENTTVNCITMFQKGEKQYRGSDLFHSDKIHLLQWYGQSFQQNYRWENVPDNEWVRLVVGKETEALGADRCRDDLDWERCNDTGWNCTRYPLEDMCNETYQGDTSCDSVEMREACRSSCCLCGSQNGEHCYEKDLDLLTGVPAFVLPVAAGGGGFLCLNFCGCCLCWKRRWCHKRRCCRACCRCLDRCARRDPDDDI